VGEEIKVDSLGFEGSGFDIKLRVEGAGLVKVWVDDGASVLLKIDSVALDSVALDSVALDSVALDWVTTPWTVDSVLKGSEVACDEAIAVVSIGPDAVEDIIELTD